MSKSNGLFKPLDVNLHIGAMEHTEDDKWSMFDSTMLNLSTKQQAILDGFEELPAPGERAALLAHIFGMLGEDEREGILRVISEHLSCYRNFIVD